MEAEFFLQRIAEEFPEIQWKRYRFVTHGWDHVVLILDEKIVFRAPKDTHYRNEFRYEIELLHHLNKKVAVGIPEYIHVSRDTSFAGYIMVPGCELTRSRFTQLSDSEKELIARQLAGFITTLHATPQSIIRQYNVRTEDQNALFSEFVRDVKEILFPRLTEKDIRLIEEYLAELKSTLKHEYQRALAHNDLGSEHILWDDQEHRVNIIDFSDRSYGDPAIDFTGLLEYGPQFQNWVYELYGGKKDEKMLYRSYLYYKRVPLYLMVDALKGYPCTFEEGYEMFKTLFTPL
jgi:aminoglycoside phosphotransferase (APT) family kinase protein